METVRSTIEFPFRIPTLGKSHMQSVDRENQDIWRAQCGDLEAFNNMVLAYQNTVYRQAYWMLKDEEEAADATQDVFLRAYRKLNTFHGGSFRAWLLRITTNVCLDQIRSTMRHPHFTLSQINEDGDVPETHWVKDPGVTPEQAVERAEAKQRIAGAIHRLAPDFRSVVILVDLQGLDYSEASTVLHIPMGTVKSRLARGRSQLRMDLQKSMEVSSGSES